MFFNFFKKKKELTLPISEKYRFPVFKNSETQELFVRQGYVVLPFLSFEELQVLQAGAKRFIENLPEEPQAFTPSGRLDDTVLRQYARELSESIFLKNIYRYINEETCECMGGSFLLKPPTKQSGLAAHQDSSLVDETKYYSIFAWIPLCDVTEKNGAVYALPGSHHLGNHYRSLDVPWDFLPYQEWLAKKCTSIPMKAGELLLFDSALIHGSPPNRSKHIRSAINYLIKPREAQMIHSFCDQDTPPGKVECYKIDLDFFYNCDYRHKPFPEQYPLMEILDLPKLKVSKKLFT